MVWDVEYLPEVYDDLKSLGNPEARRILKVIEKRIAEGEPDKLGKPLRKTLAGCRRIRTGDTRIVAANRRHPASQCVASVVYDWFPLAITAKTSNRF